MNRFAAFFTHLFISAVVVGIFLAVTFFVWYPAPYFEVDGANSVIGILAMVDVFLGPILTFIVFKSGKPRLKLDLGMIAAVQLTAFVYGAHVIFTERPGYVVHLVDSFLVVPTSAVDFSESSYPELEVGLFTGPTLTYLRYRKEGESFEQVLARISAAGDISTKAEFYEPYENGVEDILAQAMPASRILEKSEKDAAVLQKWLREHNLDVSMLMYARLTGKNKAMAMLLDASSGEPLGAIDVTS
jgi:hypothetical protein